MIQFPNREEIEDCYSDLKSKGITSNVTKISSGLYVKCDGNLPMNSYKIRGAQNFFRKNECKLQRFEVLSAGNLALAVAHECRVRNFSLTAIVPKGISQIKKERLATLGAEIKEIEFGEIWTLVLGDPESLGPHMIHPFHKDLLCGYSSVVLETLDQVKECKALVVPYGLGGLATSVVHARDLFAPHLKIYAVEMEGFSPLTRALEYGKPTEGPRLKSFIEALGTPSAITNIFNVVRSKIDGVVTVTENEVRAQIRNLQSDFGLKVEGAAGACLAGAVKLKSREVGTVVAHLTGANISADVFNEIVK